ncbi:class I SAM-dependent methyltransferase [Saccharothrix yanglingensis]|nr:methyltransferase domain-containing protein [Saccharothrix yanglingensis]
MLPPSPDPQDPPFGPGPRGCAGLRPSYPIQAVQWGLSGAVGLVVDLVTGTGELTERLAAAAPGVVAVEPDAGRRAELARRLPLVTVVEGTATAVPLPDTSVDAVFVGRVPHGSDFEVVLDEAARVLRPSGAVVVVWNRDDAIRTATTSAAGTAAAGGHRWGVDGPLPAHRRFGPFERRCFAVAGDASGRPVVTTAVRAFTL